MSAVGDLMPHVVDAPTIERLRVRLNGYMAKKGLRSTAQRRLIIDTFFEGASHRTIEELLQEVRKQDRGVGYATVYRTLKLLDRKSTRLNSSH